MPHETVRARLGPILEGDLAATCAIVDLEVLFSARKAEDHRRIRHRRALAYARIPLDDAIFDRAIEVQGALAEHGHHRVPVPDLVIAAAAEAADLVVLHYDADFDRIAAVTGQRTEWVVPRGTV